MTSWWFLKMISCVGFRVAMPAILMQTVVVSDRECKCRCFAALSVIVPSMRISSIWTGQTKGLKLCVQPGSTNSHHVVVLHSHASRQLDLAKRSNFLDPQPSVSPNRPFTEGSDHSEQTVFHTYSSATQHEVWWKYLNTYSVPFARDPSGSKGLRNEAAELMAKIQLNQHANHFNLPSCTIAQRIAALHNMHCNYCCESQSSLATEMPKRRTFQLEKWLPKNHHTFSKSW